MATKIKSYRAPVRKKGTNDAGQIYWYCPGKPGEYGKDSHFDWFENEPFREDFRIVGFSRGRSSTKMIMVPLKKYKKLSEEDWCSNIQKYEVFVSDSLEVIEAAEHGIIKGQMWEYCKKGSNYGLRIYHEKESSTQN